jgi:ABC-type transporter Mla MlaB component
MDRIFQPTFAGFPPIVSAPSGHKLSKPTGRAHLVGIDQFEHHQMEVQPEPQQLLRLPADCSIGGIRVVYDLICKALSGQQKLELDCSGVDKVDVTSVQLLLSTAKTARHLGNRVSLTAVPEVLRSVIRRAGVSSRAMPDSHPAQQPEVK